MSSALGERRSVSLAVRLAALTCASLLVVLGAGYLIQYRMTSRSMENLASEGALSIFNSVHTSMADSLEKGKMELFQQSLDQAGQGTDVLGLWLLNADGTPAYASSGSEGEAAISAQEVAGIASGGDAVLQRNGAVLDVYRADLVTPDCQRCHNGWKVGDVGAVLHLRYSLGYLEAANRQTALTSVAAFVATAVILLAVIVFGLSRWVLRPVKRLSASAGAVALGNLDTEIRRESNDEIGVLADSFAAVVSYQREMADLAEGIAAGELYHEVRARSAGDRLGHALTKMVSSLRQAVQQVVDGASNAAGAAGEASNASAETGQAISGVASTAEDVAESANRAAQAVVEANRGMGELSSAIDGIAKGAQEAASAVSSMSASAGAVAREAEVVQTGAGSALGDAEAGREAASRGTEAVSATLREMDAIRQVVAQATTKVTEMGQRSQQVSQIVRTIEDIAAQTNLLALNAQIEAARAGDQGLGFAVVADEVRKLAERSAHATQEIAVLVAAVQEGAAEAVDAIARGDREVASGVALAQQAGDVIQHLQATVQRIAAEAQDLANSGSSLLEASRRMVSEVEVVSAVVEEVSASTEEMAASSAQVADALDSVAGVAKAVGESAEAVASSTLKVSAQAEQVKALAQSVADESGSVLDAVAFFDLGQGRDADRAPAPAAAREAAIA